jgi:hypothetical protein
LTQISAAVKLSESHSSRHRLFGLTVAGDFPFTVGLLPGYNASGLTLKVSDCPLSTQGNPTLPPVYVSPFRNVQGRSLGYLFKGSEGEVLRLSGAGDFRISHDLIEVYMPVAATELAEIRLLGPVLSYWLEKQGIPTLHASAVKLGQGAVAFLSHKEGGKTGLAAAMMQAGFPLLTDDVLPVEERDGIFLGRPGYPQMRMWPDEAEHFLGGFKDLPLVHPAVTKRRVAVGVDGFGMFHDAALPLACIYLPERVPEGPVEIHEVSPRDALIELVRHSFSPHLVQAAGLQPRRLDLFARLVMEVPVRRLRYPSGFERLPEVVERILTD